jgi:hypothetical protein
MKVVEGQQRFFLGLVKVAEIVEGEGQELAVVLIRSLLTASQQLQRYFLFTRVDVLESQGVQLLNLSSYELHTFNFIWEF